MKNRKPTMDWMKTKNNEDRTTEAEMEQGHFFPKVKWPMSMLTHAARVIKGVPQ